MASEQLLDIVDPIADAADVKTNTIYRKIVHAVLALVLLTLVLVCIFCVLLYEEDVSLSEEFNKTHILHEFGGAFHSHIVEQSYTRKEGKILGERKIRLKHRHYSTDGYDRAEKLDKIAQLDMPPVLTKEFLNPLHWKVNKNAINGYEALQVAAGFMFGSLSLSKTSNPQRVLLIGLGCGNAANFLSSMPLNGSIDVVEQHFGRYNAVNTFFGLMENERLTVHIGYGAEFIERKVNETNASIPSVNRFYVIDATFSFITHYESILLDVCTPFSGNKQILCPGKRFRSPEVVENLSKLVGLTGILTMRIEIQEEATQALKQMLNIYKNNFRNCFLLSEFYTGREMILFCSNRADWSYDIWNKKDAEIRRNLLEFDAIMGTNVYDIAKSGYSYSPVEKWETFFKAD